MTLKPLIKEIKDLIKNEIWGSLISLNLKVIEIHLKSKKTDIHTVIVGIVVGEIMNLETKLKKLRKDVYIDD